jgi:hypothetical protein
MSKNNKFDELTALLIEAKALIARPDNDFAWCTTALSRKLKSCDQTIDFTCLGISNDTAFCLPTNQVDQGSRSSAINPLVRPAGIEIFLIANRQALNVGHV